MFYSENPRDRMKLAKQQISIQKLDDAQQARALTYSVRRRRQYGAYNFLF